MDFTKNPLGLRFDFSLLSDECRDYLNTSGALLATPVDGDAELMIALPQNRQYDHLNTGDRIDIGWNARAASCFQVS